MKELRIAGRTTKEILAELNLEEKAAFCSGKDFWHLYAVERLGIPSVMVTDGPHGLRKQGENSDNLGLSGSVPAVCFPTACTTACSWDPELLHQMGEAIGEEALEQKISVVLGPGANMKRSPLCGRNFEYFSEDPCLAGELAAGFIQGVQSKGVGTSLKHYATNNQETRRLTVSSEVDERALREIYLPAFETAVKKAQPWTIMNAYNKLNGTHCSENDWLQNQVLRGDWGFEGLVVSDWGAANDRVMGLQAGNDLEMPSSFGFNTAKLIAAVQDGSLEMDVLDQRVEKLLELIAKSIPALEQTHSCDYGAHHKLARKIAGESMVLLKNENGVLPLKPGIKLTVIGEMAEKPRYQGAGSSKINPTQMDDACGILREAGYNLRYAPGYESAVKKTKDEKLLIEVAVKAAQAADTVLLFIGLTDEYEAEGFDRKTMGLPAGHNALVEAVCAVNPKVVVVLSAGSPVELPWFDKVQGLLHAYLGGQAGAGAVADLLTGAVNPSGKLAETYPLALADTPCADNFPGNPLTVEYRESIYIGYRYYDKMQKAVRFPFGYGLSYTKFAYSDLKLNHAEMSDEDSLTVTFKVKNTGKVAGAEIAQLYVADKESSAYRPPKELKGFQKVFLEPGESKTMKLQLSKRAFAFYNTALQDWQVESGLFDILVGASSADIRLRGSVTVNSTADGAEIPDYRAEAAVYYTGDPAKADAAAFEALLGRPLPPTHKNPGDPIVLEDTLEAAAHTVWGGRINSLIDRLTEKMDEAEVIRSTVKQAPFRKLISMTGGLFTAEMGAGLLRVLNGDQPGKGFQMLLMGLPNLLLNVKKRLNGE